MLFTEIISNKKNRREHSQSELHFMIQGYTSGAIPDYQMSAWLMAALLNGLTDQEAYLLTAEVMNSGTCLDFSDLPFTTVDKHSTGGVGDKTSLIVGPIVAAAGVGVPMIAGRGLGHTGGTVDKLESIPGFNTQLSLEKFKSMVRENRLSIIGQTDDLCPADKKMYALRDVTSTIDSIPIICASIMSKKIAEGMSGLVLDIKYGNGAFMKTTAEAEKLSTLLISVGKKFGRTVSALVTNMNQPLGEYSGNSLEIEEVITILKNDDTNDDTKSELLNETRELSLELAADMFVNGKAVKNIEEGKSLAKKMLASGAAHEKFAELCKLQGGDLSALPKPAQSLDVLSPADGFIEKLETREIGLAGVVLGAGRLKASDKVNPVAGLRTFKKVGATVKKNEPLFTVFCSETKKFDEVRDRLLHAVTISKNKTPRETLIWKRIH